MSIDPYHAHDQERGKAANMPAKSKFQIKVEGTLLKYINGFLRYARFSHLGTDRRELIAGTFVYLLDEDDLVPDNVPNIGYLVSTQ